MVYGIALYNWDQKIGAVLEAKYPESLELSTALINKIYSTHAYSQDFKKEELIETNYEDQIVISYCDKTRVADVGYEIIILLIHEKERINSYQLKRKLINFSKNILIKMKSERAKYFLNNVQTFFEKPAAKKLLLLGRAGTGKTSIKKIIFEGSNPNDLLYYPLEPTRGINPSIYSWLDLNLGLFDSAGQELDFLLKDENEQKIAFENTDTIIYLIDYQLWLQKSKEILNEIQSISNILESKCYNSCIVLFFHKIDLINEQLRNLELEKITEVIKERFNLPIFYTSIHPNLIYSLYNAFYELLSGFSEETKSIKLILDKNIKDISKIMCFISDQNNSIIVQTMSKDFNILLINHSHKLLAQINQTFEDMSEAQIDHLIISSTNNINIIMNNLNLKKFKIKNFVAIAENLTGNKLIFLMGQIRTQLNHYFYYQKI